MRVTATGRARRILDGWSANLLQTLLGVVQQVALIPIFLHFWSSEVLAAWLALYSIGNLFLIVDAGLQMRAINRFLILRACVDPNGRTAQFFSSILRIYVFLAVGLSILVLITVSLLRPSTVLGFSNAHFDLAFVFMALGTILTLVANPAVALYRARGFYGRIVKIQCWSMIVAQFGELVSIVTTQSLLVVTIAYVTAQLLLVVMICYDAPRLFPFLRWSRVVPSWRWVAGQFEKAFPFAIMVAAESAIVHAPVLLVSYFVSDRVAVVQWGLTRVIASLVRSLSIQATLPLAAELGHDQAVGKIEQLRSLYARGSALVTLMASIIISGLLAFWPDFFAIWTHDSVPYDAVLTVTLLIGTSAVAPSILALSYANYTDRGRLLAWVKGAQLLAFIVMSLVLIPRLGPLGAAIAIVASDLVIQSGVFTTIILRQTLAHPARHTVFLICLMVAVIATGWAFGLAIRSTIGGKGIIPFVLECATWLILMSAMALPLMSARIRAFLNGAVPH